MQLAGKLALITGASQGIGAATARAMAARGAKVLLLARSAERLDQLAAEIESSGGRARAYPMDVSDADAVATAAEAISAELGTPDVIVNNAGIGRWLFIEETSPEEMRADMAVPYFAAFYVTRAFVAQMARRGSGVICNVNGPGAWFPWPGSIAYASARWALRGFSNALRSDLRGSGVKITDVVMARVSSEYWANNPGCEERIPWADRLIPTLSPEQAGEIVTSAVERERREVHAPFMWRVLHATSRFFPRLAQRFVYVGGARRPPS